MATTSTTRRPIPKGYVLLRKEKSHPRNGRSPLTYAYYKDAAGNYGFQMEESKYNSFFRLGKVLDPQSTIGRFKQYSNNEGDAGHSRNGEANRKRASI
jgi:hypothetical protein